VHWRQAAKDGAVLFAVLRIFTFARLVAFVDAAQEAGWAPLFEHFQVVPCPGNKEKIPSLAFTAVPSEPVSEEVALSHWMNAWVENLNVTFVGGPALAIYRALADKQVLAQREYRNDRGYATREELGICGAFGYVFSQDARPDYRMTLMTIAQAESQRQSFGRPVQQQPYGTFTVYA
jgi:hypothetical protein